MKNIPVWKGGELELGRELCWLVMSSGSFPFSVANVHRKCQKNWWAPNNTTLVIDWLCAINSALMFSDH